MSRSARIVPSRQDDAVAEIIGTILLIAVAIVVFTGFLAWYIPTTVTANENHYQTAERSAFNQMVSYLNSPDLANGSIITGFFPLGISGAQPFEPATPTEVYVHTGSFGFNTSVKFNLSFTASNGTSKKTYYVDSSTVSQGILASYGVTQYVAPIQYLIADSSLIEVYGNDQPASLVGPLPLSVTNTGSVSVVQSGFSGTSQTISGTSSADIIFTTAYVRDVNLHNGSVSDVNGQIMAISNITVSSMTYTINSTYAKEWNYALFRQYNTTTEPFSSVSSIGFWNFTDKNFDVQISGNSLSISLKAPLKVQLFSFRSYNLQVMQTV